MRKLCVPVVSALVLLSTVSALAQSPGARSFADGRVRVQSRLEPTSVRPGETLSLVFDLEVKPGFYIYAPSSPFAAPEIQLDLPAGLAAEGALKGTPEPKEKVDPALGPVHTYPASARFTQLLRIAPDARAGRVKAAGLLAIQACDDRSCVVADVPFVHELEIVVAAPTPGPPPPPAPAPKTASDESFAALLAIAVLSGLATLLLPCTYPMVPVTISIFSKGKTLSRAEAVARAAVYAAGIVFSFTLIGGVIQAVFETKGQAKLNEIAADGTLNLVIAAAFIYFAFSFFGFYEIGLPAPFQKLLSRASAGRASDGGVSTKALFLMGLFFVLTTYTCGAPLVLGVLAQAAATPTKLSVVIATAIFGATIALPFFFLALVPSFVRALPKGGGWFFSFKTVLGFLEIAFAFKFLRTADVAFDLGVISRTVLLGVWILCAGLSVAYLLGWLRVLHEGEEAPARITLGRLAWAFVFALAAIYLASGLQGRKLGGAIEALMLSSGETEAAVAAPGHRFGRLTYGKDLDRGLARARVENRRVFLMFTGHT